MTDFMVESLFKLRAAGVSARGEVLAGLTTFLTMASILFVNPDILAQAGMDHGAVFVATCLAAAIGSAVMGLLANYPIAQAPGMGINAFFTFGLVKGLGLPWQTALGAVFVSGVLFMLVSITRLREGFVNGIPLSLKQAISAGVGLFIALIALQQAGVVVANPDTLVGLGDLHKPQALLALAGFALIVTLERWRVPGAILLGILAITALSAALGLSEFNGVFAAPPSLAPTWLQLDVAGALAPGVLSVVLGFFLMSLTETSGTLIAVAQRGPFLDAEGKLPRLNRALLADSAAISVGALLGTSSTTSYLESSAGIAAGGRTGLTAVTVAGLFLASLFFAPLAAAVPPWATAPALVYVAMLMLKGFALLNWDDITEAAPALLCALTMAFTFSIADGIAFGAIAFVTLNLAAGRRQQIGWPVALIASVFVLKYVLS
jgi:AGZA family xanthine/uracil permease-like MFS transporter